MLEASKATPNIHHGCEMQISRMVFVDSIHIFGCDLFMGVHRFVFMFRMQITQQFIFFQTWWKCTCDNQPNKVTHEHEKNKLTVKQVNFAGNLISQISRKVQIREVVNFTLTTTSTASFQFLRNQVATKLAIIYNLWKNLPCWKKSCTLNG